MGFADPLVDTLGSLRSPTNMTPDQLYTLNVGASIKDIDGTLGTIADVRKLANSAISYEGFFSVRWVTRTSDSVLDYDDSVIDKFQVGAPTYGTAVQAFDTQAPTSSSTPASGYTVGAALRFPSAGRITQLWYYRYAAGMTTSRTLRLWAYAGGQVASGQTVSETGTGWKSASLATPFVVAAGEQYIATTDIPAGDTYGYKTIATCPSDTSYIVLVEGRWATTGIGTFPPSKTSTNTYLNDVSFEPQIG